MNIGNKLKKFAVLSGSPSAVISSFQNIFLVSHMRARSSVLSHILGSHPSIAGYYEQHISHKMWLSNLRVKAALLEEGLISPRTQYIFDKVLHCHLDPPPRMPGARVILLRRPENTLKSIIRMGELRRTRWKDEKESLSYYCNRLRSISNLSQESAHKFFLIRSEDIVENPSVVLQRLTSFLDLQTPLNAEYDIFEKTGEAVSGDPSDVIKSRTILTKSSSHDVVLSPMLLAEAEACYGEVLAEMQKRSCIEML